MRLSSLSLAVILLCSSVVFAQHHDVGSTASPAPPNPAPTAAASPSHSSPTAAPAPRPAQSHSNNTSTAGSSPASAPSAPVPSSGPESRTAPSSGRVISDQKISGESRIASAPRIGQNPPEKPPEMKPGPPNLHHRICDDVPCKEKNHEWRANPPRSDLRHRVCPNGPCACPTGKVADDGRCIANPPAAQPFDQCSPGEFWNGASCAVSAAACSSIDGRAAALVAELRGLKAQVQDECGQDPAGQDSEDLKRRNSGALQRYEMLLNEATPMCRATLADLGSLE